MHNYQTKFNQTTKPIIDTHSDVKKPFAKRPSEDYSIQKTETVVPSTLQNANERLSEYCFHSPNNFKSRKKVMLNEYQLNSSRKRIKSISNISPAPMSNSNKIQSQNRNSSDMYSNSQMDIVMGAIPKLSPMISTKASNSKLLHLASKDQIGQNEAINVIDKTFLGKNQELIQGKFDTAMSVEHLEKSIDTIHRRKHNKFESQRVSPTLRHPFMPAEVLPFSKRQKGKLLGGLQSYNGKSTLSLTHAGSSILNLS